MNYVAWRPNIPALEDILGSIHAKVLMDILCDYAYKSTNDWQSRQGESDFGLDSENYIKRSAQATLMYVSTTRENLSRSITKLVSYGVLNRIQTKSALHPNGINRYKPYIGTDLYIRLAKETLLTNPNEFVRARVEAFISVLEECDSQIIFDVFGINHTFKVTKKAPRQRDSESKVV